MQPFIIPLKGLNAGKNVFEWHADGKFFESFENPDVTDAAVAIHVEADNGGVELEVKCTLEGYVVVPCDRCLAPLRIPVSACFEESGVYDLNQDIYDYICISLPIQRIHPDGECDEETTKYLSK